MEPGDDAAERIDGVSDATSVEAGVEVVRCALHVDFDIG